MPELHRADHEKRLRQRQRQRLLMPSAPPWGPLIHGRFFEVPVLSSSLRVGVFVDAENVRYNGGYQMRYDVLRRFAAREGGSIQRLNTYIAFDVERAREDREYAKKARAYQQMVRDFGWKITVKPVRRYTDENGNVTTKANADLDMAVDVMLQAGASIASCWSPATGTSFRWSRPCRTPAAGSSSSASRTSPASCSRRWTPTSRASWCRTCCRSPTSRATTGASPAPACAGCAPSGSRTRATASCAS
jgi:hypothetical protein